MKLTRKQDEQINRMAEDAVRRIANTPSTVRRLDARPDFFMLEDQELTDAETKALIEHGVREEIHAAICRITGRVN